MGQVLASVLFAGLLAFPGTPSATAQSNPQDSSASGSSSPNKSSSDRAITVPAGTRVILALTGPVWAKSARPGLRVYAQTYFPVAMNNIVVIPPGTYVEGLIDAVKRPTRFSNHAQFRMHFTKWIFANGYTVQLAGSGPVLSGGQMPVTGGATSAAGGEDEVTADVLVDVSYASDILLDNGTQIEMVVQRPVSLDAAQIAQAARVSRPLSISRVQSATRCRPVPGTPGTSDTVIPGTPGTSGTPDIVVPGAPGMPPTVIPGIPPTQGTPPTVIPGSPGTPGVGCPEPPTVVSTSNVRWDHTEDFQIATPFILASARLPAGRYQAAWTGLGPQVQVSIFQDGNEVANATAQVARLGELVKENSATTREDADGTKRLVSLKFAKENTALSFEDVKKDTPGGTKAPN